MRRALLFVAFVFAAGCGGNSVSSSVEQSINVDSMIRVMAVRYDALCYERKSAFAERDPEVRRELLEQNDIACRALQDSLQWILSLRENENRNN